MWIQYQERNNELAAESVETSKQRKQTEKNMNTTLKSFVTYEIITIKLYHWNVKRKRGRGNFSCRNRALNFLNLTRNINLQIQELSKTLNRMNLRKFTMINDHKER